MKRPYAYWDFIVDNLPNYYHRDDVLESDILARFLDGEDLCPEDEEMIASDYDNSKEKVKKKLLELDKALMAEAMEAYFVESC